MPELTYEQLPAIFAKNEKIKHEVNHYVRYFLKNASMPGWDINENAMEWIEQNTYVIQAPIEDQTIGGFLLKRDDKIICYMNTWQPRAYQNFVLFHEIFHILANNIDSIHLVESDLDNNIEERKADYFASIMLMDGQDVISFYNSLKTNDGFSKVLLTMNHFKAPYKAVLIRLFELGLIDEPFLKELFDTKFDLEKEIIKLGKEPVNFQRSHFVKFSNLEEKMTKSNLPEIAHVTNIEVYNKVKKYFDSKGGN